MTEKKKYPEMGKASDMILISEDEFKQLIKDWRMMEIKEEGCLPEIIKKLGWTGLDVAKGVIIGRAVQMNEISRKLEEQGGMFKL